MMGRSHAISGGAVWLLGCAGVQGAGVDLGVPVLVVGTMVCAGWAIMPDIDHPNSTVSNAAGAATRAVADAAAYLSSVVHRRTRTPVDRPSFDGHRTLTHTIAWALLCGLLAAAAGLWGGPWAAAVLVFCSAELGARAALPPRWRWRRWSTRWLFDRKSWRHVPRWARRVPVPVPAAIAGVLAVGAFLLTPGSDWWLGVAVAVGSVTHCLGDMVTNSGCPLFWPIRIGGRAWHKVRGPGELRVRRLRVELRFDTNGQVELKVVQPLLLVAAVGGAMLAFAPLVTQWWAAVQHL